MHASQQQEVRNDWSRDEVLALFGMPFNDLLFQAQTVHRQNFNPNEVQLSTLLSIKTGACPEDCKYCPQSARYDTGLEKEKLMQIEQVIEAAKAAKASGSSRFCMGAAWRSPHDRDIPAIEAMIKEVKSLGLETCMTLGMLSENQADTLSEAGLDYYNHNLDTSKEFYGDIITTRTFQDRLDTLSNVRSSGMKVCSGGIVGMGEEQKDRAGLLMGLANLPKQPDSVPINMLVQSEIFLPKTPAPRRWIHGWARRWQVGMAIHWSWKSPVKMLRPGLTEPATIIVSSLKSSNVLRR